MQRTVDSGHKPHEQGLELDQQALIREATRGNAGAYEELVRTHYRRVHGTAFRLVGNHEDAEDLTQECFLRAHRSLHWFRGDGAFAGWLRRILIHLVRDRFRREGRRPDDGPPLASLPEIATEDGPGHEARQRELSRILGGAIERLPDHLRIALVLRTREGLPYADIAEATGVTAATARTQVMKARRTLLRQLGRTLDLYIGRGGR